MSKLYIIHGWTYSLQKWDKACTLLRQNGIEPVMLRVPGLTEPSDKVWTIDDYVGWLRSKLENDPHPVVMGHSNGGRIILAYNQKHPDHIAQLLLVDSAGVYDARLHRRFKLAVLRIISRFGKIFARSPFIKKIFYRVIGAQDYSRAPANMQLTMRNMLAANKNIDPTKSTMPTAIIWGKEDTVTPMRDAQILLGLMPQAKLFVIDGARHAPQTTHPEKFVEIVSKCISYQADFKQGPNGEQ